MNELDVSDSYGQAFLRGDVISSRERGKIASSLA
jgi:hypothetical protein